MRGELGRFLLESLGMHKRGAHVQGCRVRVCQRHVRKAVSWTLCQASASTRGSGLSRPTPALVWRGEVTLTTHLHRLMLPRGFRRSALLLVQRCCLSSCCVLADALEKSQRLGEEGDVDGAMMLSQQADAYKKQYDELHVGHGGSWVGAGWQVRETGPWGRHVDAALWRAARGSQGSLAGKG